MALKYEQQESDGLGASVAQQVLSVTEAILQEASSQQQVIARTVSEEVRGRRRRRRKNGWLFVKERYTEGEEGLE